MEDWTCQSPSWTSLPTVTELRTGREENSKEAMTSSPSTEEMITLLHGRLGHPSCTLLKTMYPELFE